MMTRTPSKTIWVGRIGSKRDQPLVTTDALYYRGVGGHRVIKTLTKLKNFGMFQKVRSKGTRKSFRSKEIPTFCNMNHPIATARMAKNFILRVGTDVIK